MAKRKPAAEAEEAPLLQYIRKAQAECLTRLRERPELGEALTKEWRKKVAALPQTPGLSASKLKRLRGAAAALIWIHDHLFPALEAGDAQAAALAGIRIGFVLPLEDVEAHAANIRSKKQVLDDTRRNAIRLECEKMLNAHPRRKQTQAVAKLHEHFLSEHGEQLNGYSQSAIRLAIGDLFAQKAQD